MTRTILWAAAGALMASSASAAPLFSHADFTVQPTLTENVRLVCDEDGRCYRTQGRRYVDRRYYGGDSYYGESYGRRGYVEPSYGYREPGYGYGYGGGGPSIGFSFGSGRY